MAAGRSNRPRPPVITAASARPGPPRRSTLVVGGLALLSAVGAVAARPEATGTGASDIVAAALLGVGVTVVASRATPWSWLTAALVLAAGAPGPWAAPALGAAALAALVIRQPEIDRRRVLGAVVGAALVQTLLRLSSESMGTDVAVSVASLGCLAGSCWHQAAEPARRQLRRAATVVGGVAALLVAGLLVSLVQARGDLQAGIARADDGLQAARDGQSDDAADRFDDAKSAFRSAHRDLSAWWARPALVLPVVGQHVRAMTEVTDAGAALADAAAISSRTARVQDLKVTDGRLDLDRVRSLAGPLAAVRVALDDADAQVADVGSPWLVGPVASRVREFQQTVDDAVAEAAIASDAVAVLPDVLGGSGPRNYLVAFGTPAETRELGGFMGAYAILSADQGELSLASTGRVRNLNTFLKNRTLSDESVLPGHLLALQPERFFQNITATPDFPTVAEVVHQMWPGTGPGRLDGVLYMDPETLAALLDLTGPIMVPSYDRPLTADTAGPFLLRQQYIDFPEDDRHDFLVDAAETVFEELTSGELPSPAVVADTLAPSVHEGRLLVSSFHPEEQALFEDLHLDGGLPPVQGDFLSVRASNRGQSKIDAFMQRTVEYDVTLDPFRGTAQATVTVTVRNDAPASGLPDVVIGNRAGQPSGTNSTTIAVYTPLELIDVTQEGRPIGRGAEDEYDRFRYTALVDVPAGEEVTVVFELAGPIDLTRGYHLEVVPQPLVNPDQLEVRVRGAGGWFALGDNHLVTDLREAQHLDAVLFR